MAHSLSAKKNIRQNAKNRSLNRWRKGRVKEAIKAFDEAVTGGDAEKAAEQLKVCYKRLDQVAAKNTIHKNAAARRKASLARKLSKMK